MKSPKRWHDTRERNTFLFVFPSLHLCFYFTLWLLPCDCISLSLLPYILVPYSTTLSLSLSCQMTTSLWLLLSFVYLYTFKHVLHYLSFPFYDRMSLYATPALPSSLCRLFYFIFQKSLPQFFLNNLELKSLSLSLSLPHFMPFHFNSFKIKHIKKGRKRFSFSFAFLFAARFILGVWKYPIKVLPAKKFRKLKVTRTGGGGVVGVLVTEIVKFSKKSMTLGLAWRGKHSTTVCDNKLQPIPR